jgi:hypothetical protein
VKKEGREREREVFRRLQTLLLLSSSLYLSLSFQKLIKLNRCNLERTAAYVFLFKNKGEWFFLQRWREGRKEKGKRKRKKPPKTSLLTTPSSARRASWPPRRPWCSPHLPGTATRAAAREPRSGPRAGGPDRPRRGRGFCACFFFFEEEVEVEGREKKRRRGKKVFDASIDFTLFCSLLNSRLHSQARRQEQI